MDVLREVRLYGPLRAQFGKSHWLAVDSPAEAVRALSVLLHGFKQALQRYTHCRVWVGEGTSVDARTTETVGMRAAGQKVIRIAPVIHGAKRGGVGQFIIGLVVAIIGIYTSPYDGGMTLQAGIGMMLGGAVQMLSPQRRNDGSNAKNETSYTFNGPVNVSSPGAPVPLLIGRVLTGSVVASAGISTDDITPPAVATPPEPELPPEQPQDPFEPFDLP